MTKATIARRVKTILQQAGWSSKLARDHEASGLGIVVHI